MSWLEFFATIIGSLAWPVAAVVVALVFRKQLRALLSGPLSRVRAGPLEVEWDRQLSEAEVDLGEPGARSLDGPTVAELTRIAQQSPVNAVMAGFAKVEAALRELLSGQTPHVPVEGSGAVRLARAGLELGVVTEESVRAIEGLAVLRNLAAHGRETDLDAHRAIDYLAMVDAVLFALSRPPAS